MLRLYWRGTSSRHIHLGALRSSDICSVQPVVAEASFQHGAARHICRSTPAPQQLLGFDLDGGPNPPHNAAVNSVVPARGSTGSMRRAEGTNKHVLPQL